ncbi:uncharacterized protein M6B38_316660 [Iris pallida]|uniref:BACK domain-containing protein n=1 Tax=Iris pallida TaxID=29817 RepID=A0AAX6HEY5_IRIPA|nr:uncharacterized protein M6B38_316660 [Iris pallida]
MGSGRGSERTLIFFHSCVNQRRKRLHIHSIKRADGTLLSNRSDISKEAINFFSSLFSKTSVYKDEEFLDAIPSLISDEDNNQLMKPLSPTEVLYAAKLWITEAQPDRMVFQEASSSSAGITSTST